MVQRGNLMVVFLAALGTIGAPPAGAGDASPVEVFQIPTVVTAAGAGGSDLEALKREKLATAVGANPSVSATTWAGMTRKEFDALKAEGRAPEFLTNLKDRLPASTASGIHPRRTWPKDAYLPRRTPALDADTSTTAGPPWRVNSGWIQQTPLIDATLPPPGSTANHEAIPTVAADSNDRIWVSMLWQNSSDAILGGWFDGILVFQSPDRGETWLWNAAIWNNNSPVRSMSWPHVAVDPNGNRVYVTYQSEDWDGFGYRNEGIYSIYYDPYGGAPITYVNVWTSLGYDSVYPIVATEFNQGTNYVTVAFQDFYSPTDADVITARSTNRGGSYPSVWYLASSGANEGLPWIASGATGAGTSLMTVAYQVGNPADVLAVTASRGDPALFSSNPKNVVLQAAAFGGTHHDPCVAHAHGSGDVIVTSEVDIGAGHSFAFNFSTNDGGVYSLSNYWFGNADIRRFPIIAVDGLGRTSVNPAWDNFHAVYFYSTTSTTRGTVRYLWADATTNPPSWYTLTSSPDASDDAEVAAGSQCVSVTSYGIGLPGIAWQRQPSGVNRDIYYTTLGGNYQFDTERASVHINLTVDVDTVTLPTVDYEAWPTDRSHTVVAPAAGDIGIYHHGFLDWTWIGGSQVSATLGVISEYYDGFPPAPIVAYDANYDRCALQQPSIGNTLLATKVGGLPNLFWTNPGGDTEGYRIYRSTVAGLKAVFAPIGTTTSTSYYDTTATGALYFFKALAYCGTQPGHMHEGPWGNLLADFTSNAPVCDGSNNVSFVNLTNGGVPPYVYEWNFGDGSPLSGVTNPSHTYTTPPYSRSVTLTVTDSDSPVPRTSNITRTIGTGTAVGAAFTFTKVGLTATFDGTPSGGTGSYLYGWQFGDNGTSMLQDPAHTYAAAGDYTVSFTVIDPSSGCSAAVVQLISVP